MSDPTDMELAIVALQAAATAVAGSGDSAHAITEHVIGASSHTGRDQVGMADQFYNWLTKKRDSASTL